MKSILLVEDTADLAAVIRRELEASGYEVQLAPDGLSALTQHEARRPDLVILDWMLPGLNGLEVLRRLRQTAPTPVLMLTARDDETDRVLGLESGADDYLTKPFAMRELLARVRAIFRRVALIQHTLQADQSSAGPVLRHGALTLDPASFQATLNNQPLALTRIEFELLHLLMRNPGRAFNRDYLLETVWGQQAVAGDRAVDNVVLRLRKKLGPLGNSIETVWGTGYRWQGGA